MAVTLDGALLVLAGGESRRMGRSKALLPVGPTTLIEWIVARLAPGMAELLVAARSEAQLPPALRPHLVGDRHPGAGPLAGIEAGLVASRHEIVVAVACDMPWVTPELVARLVAATVGRDAAVPRIEGRPEPVCAAYRRRAAPALAGALAAGRLQAGAAVEELLDVRWLDGEDPALFANLNTPADYERFRASVGAGRSGPPHPP
jgi:molybdopterin-guanine dinucleotide biosynthesis protein A